MRNLMELIPTNAYLITEKCEVSDLTPRNGKDFELDEVQKCVDGFIEVLWLTREQIMIVNEEGKFSKGYNVFATAVAHLHKAIRDDDYIAGDVVICPSKMLD